MLKSRTIVKKPESTFSFILAQCSTRHNNEFEGLLVYQSKSFPTPQNIHLKRTKKPKKTQESNRQMHEKENNQEKSKKKKFLFQFRILIFVHTKAQKRHPFILKFEPLNKSKF